MADEIISDVEVIQQIKRKPIIEDWAGSCYQKWAKGFCARNAWRVVNVLGDYDDCLAKCALDFVICRQRYGGTVNSPQHFMYMYTTWVRAEFHSLSTHDTNNRKMQEGLSTEEIAIKSDAEMVAALSTASAELKSVMKIFLNAPQEMMELLRKDTGSRPNQFWNSVLNLCGISPAKSKKLATELQLLLKH